MSFKCFARRLMDASSQTLRDMQRVDHACMHRNIRLRSCMYTSRQRLYHACCMHYLHVYIYIHTYMLCVYSGYMNIYIYIYMYICLFIYIYI